MNQIYNIVYANRVHPEQAAMFVSGTAGQQLRKSEQNSFHDNFLNPQPNPMM